MLRKESCNIKREAGFTLLEVLVVLTLILLLASLVYPASNTLQERLLIRLSLDQLKDDFAALRAQALGGGDPLVITFVPGADYYHLQIGALSLERKLVGLKITAESEIKIVFSVLNMADLDLTLSTMQGNEYQLTFDNRGELVIKQK